MYLELFSAVLVIIILVIITRQLIGTKYEKLLLLSALYIAVIIYFTTVRGARYGLGGVSFKFPLPFLKALLNFHYGLTANRSLLNILLFVPFGFFTPVFFYYIIPESKFNSLKDGPFIKPVYTVILGFLLSLIIETVQLVFSIGVFEIDDLIKNTLGALLGFFVFKKLISVKFKTA